MNEVNTADIDALLVQLPLLTTFADVALWDDQARAKIDTLDRAIQSIDVETAQKQQALAQVERESGGLRKMFGGGEKKRLDREISELAAQKDRYQSIRAVLQGRIEVSPNDAQEAAALKKELYLKKRELQTELKEVNAAMREIRTGARQKSAKLPGTFLGAVGGSSYRAAARRDIRYQKEGALAPYERAKAELEGEIIQVERSILWVDRLS